MTRPQLQVVACRWVSEEAMEQLTSRLPPGIAIPPVYPGSVQRPCQGCGAPVWVGPKSQEHLEANAAIACCFVCAAQLVNDNAQEPGDVTVTSLGNTFVPADKPARHDA